MVNGFVYDDGIKLVLSGCEVPSSRIINMYGITVCVDFGTDLGYLHRSSDDSWNGKI